MSKINCFVQIQESSDPFKPALDAVDQYEHVDRLVLKRVSQIKNEDEVFVEQNMSQKLKFHQKEGVKFIYCFLQPRSLLGWKKKMQLSQTVEFLKGETVARVTPEKI